MLVGRRSARRQIRRPDIHSEAMKNNSAGSFALCDPCSGCAQVLWRHDQAQEQLQGFIHMATVDEDDVVHLHAQAREHREEVLQHLVRTCSCAAWHTRESCVAQHSSGSSAAAQVASVSLAAHTVRS